MTATNHALTGALIGLAIGNPWVAAPLALLSHYVLDVIPHFGDKDNPDRIKTTFFRNFLLVDALFCVLLVGTLAVLQPQYWFLACVCAFLGAAPDMSYISAFIDAKKKKPHKFGLYNRLGIAIQWYEKPEGALVEFAWFCMAIALLIGFF